MSLNRTIAGSAIFFSLLAGSAYADECEAVLKGGVFDVSSGFSSSSTQKSFMSWFCTREASSVAQMSSLGGGMTIPVDGLPVTFKGQKRDENSSNYQKAACGAQSEFIAEANSSGFFKSLASPVIIEAWKSCVAGSTDGITLRPSVILGQDAKTFFVKLRFRSNAPAMTPTAEVSQVLVTEQGGDPTKPPVTIFSCKRPRGTEVLTGADAMKNLVIGAGQEAILSCNRNPEKTLSVEIETPFNSLPASPKQFEINPVVGPPPPAPCIAEFGTSQQSPVVLAPGPTSSLKSCVFASSVKSVDIKVEGGTWLSQTTGQTEQLAYKYIMGLNASPVAYEKAANVAFFKIDETFPNIEVKNPGDFKVGIQATRCSDANNSPGRTCSVWAKFTVTPK